MGTETSSSEFNIPIFEKDKERRVYVPINDYLAYRETGEGGGEILVARSDDMLEEDLSQMERSPTTLTVEEHKSVVNLVYAQALRYLGRYVPETTLKQLFPGMNVEDFDKYDFANAKIKIFLLSDEDFKLFGAEYYQEQRRGKNFIPFGRTSLTSRKGANKNVNSETVIDMSEKKLIVVNELPTRLKNYLISNSSNEVLTRDRIKIYLEELITHEFLHTLNIAYDLPSPLLEGITDWYAHWIVYGEGEPDVASKQKGLQTGYTAETQVVSILFQAMLENGFAEDTIHRAFISNNEYAKKQVTDFLIQRYGQENFDRIMSWKFEDSKYMVRFVSDLEAKQDSEIGKFLRDYPIPLKKE